METRKIQQVGRSTLSITIPKKWANEINLKQGSQVTIEKEIDGSFKIRSNISKSEHFSKYRICIDNYKETNMLIRAIISLYLNGEHEIEFFSKNEIKLDDFEKIRDIVQHLIGLGIVEQTSTKIIIQDFLDPTKFQIENLIKHIIQTILIMQTTIIKKLEQSNFDSIELISSLEEEVDRLYTLTARQILLMFRYRNVSSKIGVSSFYDVVQDYVMVKCFEEMADHYNFINLTFENALKNGIKSDNNTLIEIINYVKNLKKITEETLLIVASKDRFKANILINKIEELFEQIELSDKNILEIYRNESFIVNINSILWHLREIVKQNKSILESIINQSLVDNK